MSPVVVKRRVVDDAIKDMLDGALAFPVSLVDRPDSQPDEPNEFFAIVYPVPGGDVYGPPLTTPEADATLEYQVTSVALDRRQASWVADEVRRVMCDRDANHQHVVALAVPEHVVMDRGQVGPIGAVTREEGVYQCVDTYEVKVSRI